MDKEILERIRNGGFCFSILSCFCNFIILFILFQKILNSLTYNFLKYIFISEIIHDIGNILNNFIANNITNFLIPFSDFLTMILFCIFSYCSVELIKEGNKNIKEKEKIYIILSFILSLIYCLIIGFLTIFINDNNDNKDKNIIAFYTNKEKSIFAFYYSDEKAQIIYICKYVHFFILVCMIIYMIIKTYKVTRFLKEKLKTDKINSMKIIQLIKILRRFPLICLLYLVFYIPSIIFYCSEPDIAKLKIGYIFTLFSVLFLSLRGFLIFLNTIQTNKIQLLIQRFFEVSIKHNFILKFDIFSKRKERKRTLKKILKKEDD